MTGSGVARPPRLVPTAGRPCPDCGGEAPRPFASGRDFEYRTSDTEFTFVRCARCGLAYLDPVPVPEALAAAYPPEYKPFHFHTRRRSLAMRIKSALDRRRVGAYRALLPGRARILDVGCGDGRVLALFHAVGGGDWEVEGLDCSPEAVRRVREQGFRAHQGSHESLDLGQSAYDLILLNQVLEHFVDPGAAVDKLRGELRPGGLLNIETPSLDGWDARLWRDRFWGGYHFPRHLTLFTEATLSGFLGRRGFEVLRVEYMLSPVFWVFSWHHALEPVWGAAARWSSDANPVALAAASLIDLAQIAVRGRTSNMRVIARKR